MVQFMSDVDDAKGETHFRAHYKTYMEHKSLLEEVRKEDNPKPSKNLKDYILKHS